MSPLRPCANQSPVEISGEELNKERICIPRVSGGSAIGVLLRLAQESGSSRSPWCCIAYKTAWLDPEPAHQLESPARSTRKARIDLGSIAPTLLSSAGWIAMMV